MGNRFRFVLAVLLTATLTYASAQKVKYPVSVRAKFISADSAVSPEEFSRPVICVADRDQAAEVDRAGGIPVMLPLRVDGYLTARETVSSLDGYIVSGCESDLFLKALCEQNVPVLGSTAMMDSISSSLWHNPRPLANIDSLVRRASTFRHAKRLMERTVTLDSHSDLSEPGCGIGERNHLSQMSIQKMREGRLSAVYLAVYMRRGVITDSAFVALKKECIATIDDVHAQINRNSDYCTLACSAEDAWQARREGRIAFFLGLENGSPIGYDLGMIPYLRSRGVTYITLCHNGDNQICHTAWHAMGRKDGLTQFGYKVVEEMNRCGVVIDLSHASDGTVYDVCRVSRTPVVCTHSTCRALFEHYRSVSDDQLRAIAATGGVVQIALLKSFMAPKKSPIRIDVEDMIRHIDHVVSTVGIDHVGVGMDMCGGGGEWDYYSSSDAVWLTVRLLEKGYSDSDIRKIWGDNFLRVLEANRQYALQAQAKGK